MLPEVEMDSFIFIQMGWNGSGNILWILKVELFLFALKQLKLKRQPELL